MNIPKEFDPLWKTGFAPIFEVVTCQNDGGETPHAKKPDPALLRATLGAMGAEGGIYVGNAVDDIHAAKAAGMLAIGVATTQDAAVLARAGADAVYPDLDTLFDALLGSSANASTPHKMPLTSV